MTNTERARQAAEKIYEDAAAREHNEPELSKEDITAIILSTCFPEEAQAVCVKCGCEKPWSTGDTIKSMEGIWALPNKSVLPNKS